MFKMKSEITKGALYLFDDAFRARRATEMGTAMGTAMAMATGMVTVTGMETVYLIKHKAFENGLAVLGEITKHPENSTWDACQLLFNNKNGIRYVYRCELERAEKVNK